MQANLESGSMQSGSMQANLEQARAALTRARQMSESSDSQPETADIPGNFQSTVVSSAQMQQRLQEVQHLLDPNMQRLASLILPRPDCPCWPRAVVCATCVSHFLANSQRASTPSRSLSIALTPALQGMKNMIQPSAGGHIFHAISCNTIVVLGNKNIRINGALVNVEVATLRVAAFRNAFRYRKDSSPSGSTVRLVGAAAILTGTTLDGPQGYVDPSTVCMLADFSNRDGKLSTRADNMSAMPLSCGSRSTQHRPVIAIPQCGGIPAQGYTPSAPVCLGDKWTCLAAKEEKGWDTSMRIKDFCRLFRCVGTGRALLPSQIMKVFQGAAAVEHFASRWAQNGNWLLHSVAGQRFSAVSLSHDEFVGWALVHAEADAQSGCHFLPRILQHEVIVAAQDRASNGGPGSVFVRFKQTAQSKTSVQLSNRETQIVVVSGDGVSVVLQKTQYQAFETLHPCDDGADNEQVSALEPRVQLTDDGDPFVCPYPTTHAAHFIECCSRQAAAKVDAEKKQSMQAEVAALDAQIQSALADANLQVNCTPLFERRNELQDAMRNHEPIVGSFCEGQLYPVVICDTMAEAISLRQRYIGANHHLFVISQDILLQQLAGHAPLNDLNSAGLKTHQVQRAWRVPVLHQHIF